MEETEETTKSLGPDQLVDRNIDEFISSLDLSSLSDFKLDLTYNVSDLINVKGSMIDSLGTHFQAATQGYMASLLAETQKVISNSTQDAMASLLAETQKVISNSTQDAIGSLLGEVSKSVALSLESFREGLLQDAGSIFNNFVPQLQVGSIFSSLPDLSWLEKELDELENTLDLTGYGFTIYLDLWSLGSHHYINSIHPRVRNAAITNNLLAFIREASFKTQLRESFLNSVILKKRWKIIDKGINAHLSRDYELCIPVFLSQLEGLLRDILLIKKMFILKRGKLYARDDKGKIKRGKDDKPIKIQGLGQMLANTKVDDHRALSTVTTTIAKGLVNERNAILHGYKTSYASASLSIKILLLIRVIANEITALEQGKIDYWSVLSRPRF